jgi:hypothetical protein
MAGLGLIPRCEGCVIEMIIGEAIVHGKLHIVITIVRKDVYGVISQKTYGCPINSRNHLDWGGKK